MKPSEKIMEIYRQIRGYDDLEKTAEILRSVLIYLDEEHEKSNLCINGCDGVEAMCSKCK